ncbi:bifunctional serine/threonine-protein kinase/formylglycine-generating enzyme family protein [Magnetospirillum sp. 15-1]|uniref:bifunctional serine/threonine-protein kinase/formylglycine-generating enzyme family protein n=1 Tax=Magnetospirillum sp. 15-1 TaxID=1979370 RepID=UPI000BBBE71F|nr:bifunctional serine/threonine-protein kinase/formylglycine-generating enzyme family protein [Magnetospirillum sp. 15-1]
MPSHDINQDVFRKSLEGLTFPGNGGVQYILTKLLGAGGFGAVYRADRIKADAWEGEVAVKIFCINFDAGADDAVKTAQAADLGRKLNELQIQARVRHDHIVATPDQGCGGVSLGTKQGLFLELELADSDLEQHALYGSQGGQVGELVQMIEDLCAALNFLHDQDHPVIHCDINPSNLLWFAAQDRWKLGDLGMARVAVGRGMAVSIEPFGTIAYMAPEMFEKTVLPESDIWALGCTIYEVLTGRLPFGDGLSDRDARKQEILHASFPHDDVNLPAPFDRIIPGCLEKDPKSRWSAKQILNTLADFREPERQSAAAETPALHSDWLMSNARAARAAIMGRWGERRWQRAAFGAALSLTVATVAGIYIIVDGRSGHRSPLDWMHTAIGDASFTPSSPIDAADAPPGITMISGTWMQAGSVFKDCPDCPEMVTIPAGSFWMGSTKEERAWAARKGMEGDWLKREVVRRRVTIAKPFAMARATATRGEWTRLFRFSGTAMRGCGENDEQNKDGRGWWFPGWVQNDDHPVVCINWNDANEFVSGLTAVTAGDRNGKGRYRLPTEAEWEYAARGGDHTEWRFWGNVDNEAATCLFANIFDGTAAQHNRGTPISCIDNYMYTAPADADQFRPNQFGLRQMIGNVMQWTQDCYLEDLGKAPTDGSAVSASTSCPRVVRGASFANNAPFLRAAVRYMAPPDLRAPDIGFRVVRDLP